MKAALQVGRGGIFEVRANGQLLFSKHEQGRFPETNEVLEQLAGLAP